MRRIIHVLQDQINCLLQKVGQRHPINDAEYFHRCSINSGYSIPHQGIHNYQEPHSGDAFVGAFFFNGWVWYREYVQTELISSLVNGKTYYVEYWVNLPSLMYSGRYAVNNIGLSFKTFFSDTTSDDSDGNVLPFNMDIYKYKNPVIDDTLNWVKINGVYKSLGGESFIVIGNFRGDDESIVVDQLNDSTTFAGGAYYFIDDVSIEEITEPFWQYHDTTVYYGDSVLIGPALTGLDINWYTANDEFIENAPGIYVQPATSRNYIAKETFNGVETTHLVHVTVIGGAGVEENELKNVAIFPNPSKGTFYLKGFPIGIETAKKTVKIFNLSGQCVWSDKLPEDMINNEQEVNTTLENGVYVMELRNENGNVETRKIVIQK